MTSTPAPTAASANRPDPRIFIGGLAHETHSFSSTPTPEAAFRAYEWAEGDEIFASYQSTGTSLGGIIAGAAEVGLELVPGFYSFAIPSGPVPAADFAALADRLLASLVAAGPIDGVILVCHGAMVAVGSDDVEADLVERVRAAIGPAKPLVVTLDYHANISARLAATADLLLGYDTYPHVDVAERGVEAAHLMRHLLEADTPVETAFAAIPILAVPQRQGTEAEPMRGLMDRVHVMEADPRVLAITLAGGFCYSDVPRAGMAATITTTGAPGLAAEFAQELQRLTWERRDDLVQRNISIIDAVRQALAAPPGQPAILVDAADNIGGGTPGDGTTLLAELLRQNATDAVVVIADPEAVALAVSIGIDGRFDAPVGGKTDQHHGPPVRVQGRVRLLSDGRFTYRGSYMTGQVREMGRTAVLDVAGNHLVLTERKTMPFDAEQLRSVGVTPEHCRAIVVKSATAWRAAYASFAGPVLEADTPGICTTTLTTLPYQQLTRPVFPLDPATNIAMPPAVVTRHSISTLA